MIWFILLALTWLIAVPFAYFAGEDSGITKGKKEAADEAQALRRRLATRQALRAEAARTHETMDAFIRRHTGA